MRLVDQIISQGYELLWSYTLQWDFFVRGIHRSPVVPLTNDQLPSQTTNFCVFLAVSLKNFWINSRVATGLKLENYYFFTLVFFLDLKLENYSVFTFLLFLDLKLENYSALFHFFSTWSWKTIPYFDGVVQDCSNSSELLIHWSYCSIALRLRNME